MNYTTNPYSAPQTGMEAAAAYASQNERASFIQRTYLHLMGAIFAFVGVECLLFTMVPDQIIQRFVGAIFGNMVSMLIFFGGFMVVGWVARSWAQSGSSAAIQYAGLLLYVLFEAVFFVPILWIAQTKIGPDVIASAGVLTLIIFGGLTAVTFVTKTDFSFLGRFLFWGGIVAFGTIIAGMIFGFNLGMFFSVAMIALASGYILYDTSNVIHHYRTDQHVAAVLALFASVAVLFYYVLRLLMELQSRD